MPDIMAGAGGALQRERYMAGFDTSIIHPATVTASKTASLEPTGMETRLRDTDDRSRFSYGPPSMDRCHCA